MRRTDLFLALVVGALAVFVAAQVGQAPRRHRRDDSVIASQQASRALDSARQSALVDRQSLTVVRHASTTTDVAPAVVISSDAPPTRDLSDIRARINGATDTYMSDMLADLNGQLVRWPDRRERGLRIWVQAMTPVRDWDLRYAQMARDAFADWGRNDAAPAIGSDASGLPLRFDFVLDSVTSDVRIVWVEQFPADAGQRVGVTRRTNDQNGWLVAALIQVAVHDSSGRAIPPAALAGIVRHEAGHALGLGHSKDPRTKMYPVEIVNDITPPDRATLRLLYQLPPGSLK